MAAIFATVTSAALGVLALRRANAVASADNVKRCVSGAKTSATGAFGEAIRPELHLDFTHTQLNHGSFGVCPRVVLAKVLEEELRLEAFPDCTRLRAVLHKVRGALTRHHLRLLVYVCSVLQALRPAHVPCCVRYCGKVPWRSWKGRGCAVQCDICGELRVGHAGPQAR